MRIRRIGPAFLVATLAVTTGMAQVSEVVLHSFYGSPRGGTPYAGVIRDHKGNLFGTTSAGGAHSSGVVYKVDPAGKETVLYQFTGGADGGNPQGGVIRDDAGNLYGTTSRGGGGAGVVYEIDTAGKETVLHTFTYTEGAEPAGALVRDALGNLYGTTLFGGNVESGVGTLFELTSAGQFTVLHNFGGPGDGSFPNGDLILDAAGNLYGTTQRGSSSAGVVFKFSASGQETILYAFSGGADGGYPAGGVIRDAAGNLYGTAGVVYKLDPTGHETVLYSFPGGAAGSQPSGSLTLDAAGNLYGVATNGGGAASLGLVYKLDPAGTESVLHTFSGQDGAYPVAGLIPDVSGALYGTTSAGGSGGAGVVFKLDAAGTYQALSNFGGGADGANPRGTLTLEPRGGVVGTTTAGGRHNAGVIFRLDAAGREKVLYSFKGEGFPGGTDGAAPAAGVIRDHAGTLFGTTSAGGPSGDGTVFRLGAKGLEKVLYAFANGQPGALTAGIVRDPSGNLYGTTSASGQGMVYKLNPGGQLTTVHTFTGPDGAFPETGVVRDSAGNLYGTTRSGGAAGGQGVVYKIDGAGQETVLHTFLGSPDGSQPLAVIPDAAGNLYGTTLGGGSNGEGTVYKLDSTGQETVLYNFNVIAQSLSPFSSVTLDAAGNLYGVNEFGGGPGGFGAGTVFKIDAAGNQTTLYTFTGGEDGGNPYGGLVIDKGGNLLGTTLNGGKHNAGTVFVIKGAGAVATR